MVCLLSALSACVEQTNDPAPQVISAPATAKLDLAVVTKAVPARVAPRASAAVSVTLRNTGSSQWKAGTVSLVFKGDVAFSGGTLTTTGATSPGQVATFRGSVTAPSSVGRYTLTWRASSAGTLFGAAISGIASSSDVTGAARPPTRAPPQPESHPIVSECDRR